jgi:hypothetical protein
MGNAMLTAEARIETRRPSRYLVQLCKHFDNKGRHLSHRPREHSGGGDLQAFREMQAVAAQARVEWSETHGTVSLPWGRCAMQATTGALTVQVEAVDEENLRRLRELVTGHIERFGRRERLQVTWSRRDAPTTSSGPPPRAVAQRRWHGRTIGLTALGVVVVAVHLGLGGAVLADWRWTGGAVGLVLVAVLAKAAVVGGFAVHRGRASRVR